MWFPSSEVYFFLKMAKRYAKLWQGSLQQRKDDDEDTNVQIHKWRESRKGLHMTTGWLQHKLHISRLTPPMLHHLAWVLQRKRTQCWHQLSWGKKKEGKKIEMHVYGKSPLQSTPNFTTLIFLNSTESYIFVILCCL